MFTGRHSFALIMTPILETGEVLVSHIVKESLWDGKQLETWILSLEDKLVFQCKNRRDFTFLQCKNLLDHSPSLSGNITAQTRWAPVKRWFPEIVSCGANWKSTVLQQSFVLFCFSHYLMFKKKKIEKKKKTVSLFTSLADAANFRNRQALLGWNEKLIYLNTYNSVQHV